MSTPTTPLPHYVVINLRELFNSKKDLQATLNDYHRQGYIIVPVAIPDGGSTDAQIVLELLDETMSFSINDKGRAAISDDVIDDSSAETADYESYLAGQEEADLEAQVASYGNSDSLFAQDAREALALVRRMKQYNPSNPAA